MIADAIVAVPGDAALSSLLTVVHQNRLGHVSRVVSSSRAPIADQLLRAGVPMEQSPALIATDRVILIFAANLCDRGARILLEHGAARAWVVTRSGTWTEIDDRIVTDRSPSTVEPLRHLPSPETDPAPAP